MGKATSPTYKVAFRRKREGKTVYKKRLALLKSGKPRLVVRKSNRGIVVQLIEFSPEGDKTLVHVSSRDLAKLGWEPKRNSPTAYLTGALAAKEAVKKGIKEAVLDIGLATPKKDAVVFAAAKGAVDAGLIVPFNGEVSEERIRGEHIAAHRKNDLPKLFEEVKAKVLA